MLVSPLNIPASLILVAGTVFCVTQAIRGSSGVVRLNYVIHALMALGMLGMVWHNVNVPLLPQVLLFGIASFWFVLQAVSRPEFNLGCLTRSERLSCLYHAAMLAAMVFMLTLPHSAVPQQQLTVAVDHSGHISHAGHAQTVAVASPSVLDVSAMWIHPAVQVLAVLFALAVLAWLLPMDRVAAKLRVGKGLTGNQPSGYRHLVHERINEAGAALVMSLMFAAISLQS